MNSFKFRLGEEVLISLTQTTGVVSGRAEYDRHPDQYQVHHVNGSGDPVYLWFDEQDLANT